MNFLNYVQQKSIAQIFFVLFILTACLTRSQQSYAQRSSKSPSKLVNVFLGTSGDHGQVSPAASYPFGMMSIGPVTYPKTHTGYDFYAKEFLGFSHGRMEGVGCQGSGGNILVKPFVLEGEKLIKVSENAGPGYYAVSFQNGIQGAFVVNKNLGLHHYRFPAGAEKNLAIDLSSVLANGFHGEEHDIDGNSLSGSIVSGTTCNAGKFKLFYYLEINAEVSWKTAAEHVLIAQVKDGSKRDVELRIGISAVSRAYAKAQLNQQSFASLKSSTKKHWDQLLGKVSVKGDKERVELFYSLLYRSLQSPFTISEPDGTFRANNGELKKDEQHVFYNGWAIWDNYKTTFPLLSIAFPHYYGDFSRSIAKLYQYGKKDYATQHEPSNTVRTEHAVVVLLDALNKGYKLPIEEILPFLQGEIDRLDYGSPDKALESCYDTWAYAQILSKLGQTDEARTYRKKALAYRDYWMKDFNDITKRDVDAMSARKMYQGTVWQYRWMVPFDIAGLKLLAGGNDTFRKQLDLFFENDYYNHANEPDIQVPYLYNATEEPWKSQNLIHKIATDTMVQHYFNDNSRGVGSYVGKIYNNRPRAFLRTMDDDAGAMSSWFVLAGLGFSPACVGEPVFYLHLPLFRSLRLALDGDKSLSIVVKNYHKNYRYIHRVILNGKELNRNWLTYQEIMAGGKIEFVASASPNKIWGSANQWIAGASLGD